MRNTYISKYRLLWMLVWLVGLLLPAQAQDADTDKETGIRLRQAQQYLDGIGTGLNYEKAYQIYAELARQKNPVALNALGMMYKHGLGVERDDERAVSYFEQSLAQGYSKAAFNLGNLYKAGDGVKQDFTRAFRYYLRSLEMGNAGAAYKVGYSYYKGFGVSQSYEKALEYFRLGDNKGRPDCTYFVGYCYIKGYGVEQNTEEGKRWIEKAADMGYQKAIDFIAHGLLERNLKVNEGAKRAARIKDPLDRYVPRRAQAIRQQAPARNMEGVWEGKIIHYDWSGQNIESETKVQITFYNDNGTIAGRWIENDTVMTAVNAVVTDHAVEFSNTGLKHHQQRHWDFEHGRFNLLSTSEGELLEGSLNLYSEVLREPGKPNYLIVKRQESFFEDTGSAAESQLKDRLLAIYPNPFNEQLFVDFSLSKSQGVQVNMYTPDGKTVFSRNYPCVNGANYITVDDDFPSGEYLLKISGETLKAAQKVIKK